MVKRLEQPMLGAMATVLAIAIAFAFMGLFSPEVFGTWVVFLVMACIPTQIVCGLVWQCSYPKLAESLSQPTRGLLFVLISAIGGAICAAGMFYTVGGGVTPTPPLIMFTIFAIVVAFWVVGVWQAWPVSAISSHPLAVGVGVLLLCYIGGYFLFNTLFNFEFMAGAPIYIEALDPKGMFMAWQVMAFCVTTVSVIMACILSNFYPISGLPIAQKSPLMFKVLASLWILLLSSIVFYIGTSVLAVDYVVYMVRGPVSFVFGSFICLNLLQGSLFSSMQNQVLKGLLLILICMVFAAIMQNIYSVLGAVFVGEMGSGAPMYELEIWLANAMLAVTFPLIVAMSDFFQLWPLQRPCSTSVDVVVEN